MKITNKTILIFAGIISILSLVFACFAFTQEDIEKHDPNIVVRYNNTLASPYLPMEISFAGENVPLEVYWVRERLEREIVIIAYQHSKTIQTIQRMPRFFPEIEKILREAGVPEDFKYLCVAESNLENVISPAKATGYWQFLEATAKSFGMTVNEDVDERYDLEASTRAACKYLKGSKDRLGSWTLAAAAYNMGEAGLKKNLERQQTSNYWDLSLNQETSRYLYRILAYKLIFEHPDAYGVKLTNAELYHLIPTKDYSVTEPITDLYQFAIDNKVTYLEMKMLNPWLRNTKLTVGYKNRVIKMPKNPKITTAELLRKVEHPERMFGE
ncbi:MAG: lytic transglycosylase domain-containing protein [Bacteroidales bacterium]|jgi:hypothetical protein|nr:lytic transglycosylase domain-containing protein [Bacteroidales bacterium]